MGISLNAVKRQLRINHLTCCFAPRPEILEGWRFAESIPDPQVQSKSSIHPAPRQASAALNRFVAELRRACKASVAVPASCDAIFHRLINIRS